MTTLHERLVQAREAVGLSKSEVSRVLAVKPESYDKWESGQVVPRANKLITLAGVVNASPAWLLDGDEDYLQTLDKDQQIAQLRNRIEHLHSVQNRMAVMLDELTCDLDDVENVPS